MTTILADIKNKTIYSDSRATLTNGAGLEFYASDSQKLFMHPSGKMIAGTFGCLKSSWSTLKRLGFNPPDYANGCLVEKLSSNGNGGVIILNKYNNHVCYISHLANKKGNTKEIKYQWVSNWDYVSGGSGSDIASAVFKRTKDSMRSMMMAGLIDKYSDTRIKSISFSPN